MQIKRVMTKNPITLSPDDSLEKAIRLLADNNITGCPVVNKSGRVVGIVSETDILKLIDAHSSIKDGDSGFFPLILQLIKGEETFEDVKKSMKEIRNTKVKDFMHKKIITINENDDLYEAAKIMNKFRVNRLPVLNANKKIVGIVTRGDIVKALEKI